MTEERQPDEVPRERIGEIAKRLALRISQAAEFSEHNVCPSESIMAHVIELELNAFAQSIQAEARQQIEELQQQLATEKELKQLNWVPKITYEQQLAEARAQVEKLKTAANLLIDYIEAHGWGSIPEPYDSINPLLKLLGRKEAK